MTKKQTVVFIKENTAEWERRSSVNGGLIGLIQIKHTRNLQLCSSLQKGTIRWDRAMSYSQVEV